jgi:hypothetical protein
MRLLELTSLRSLPQWSIAEGLELRLIEVESSAATPASAARRSSPIHPLIEDAEAPDIANGTWFIQFLVFCDAFSALGKLSSRAYPGLESQTWFGIGLASVVIFLREPNSIKQLLEDLDKELVAREEWRVECGRLVSSRLTRHPVAVKGDDNLLLSPLSSTVPSDVRGVVEEFDVSFKELYRWATVYSSDEVEPLGRLFHEVSALITELLWLRVREGHDTPKGLREFDLSDTLGCSRLIQQRMDRIVQINSALSYVISQGCYGAPPILGDSCLIRRHSLLGVARAHRALSNLVREIEAALNKQSIPASIYRKWQISAPLTGFGSARECNSSTWNDLGLPDVLLPSPAEPQPPKLVYFSGRLGFRESEYSISAAIHTLTSGDFPDWHLSTMTHEILHGHVRIIIDAIFDRVRSDDPKKTEDYWQHIFARFRAHMLGDADGNKLIDSARSVLLAYCCMVPTMGSLTQLPSRPTAAMWGTKVGEFGIPLQASVLRRRLEEENHNISEIIVHVLDLFYFYDEDFDSYNRAVWSSWRAVPSVLRDVRQYVLRMLLAQTSLDRGDEIERFARARHQLEENIAQLNTDCGPDAVLERALKLLSLTVEPNLTDRTAEANHPLFQPFSAAIRIVDFARNCLASGVVRQDLFREDFIKSLNGESGLHFAFTPGQFADRSVHSVAEFTAWRARSNGSLSDEENGEERQTAWLFLACGRLPLLDGQEFVDLEVEK